MGRYESEDASIGLESALGIGALRRPSDEGNPATTVPLYQVFDRIL